MSPKVSFVVPCYNLAHFLSECVESILAQTFTDFEVLIMDDCSPDNTGEVAASFHDPRVRYIRNEPNLGHLRNYNKGIELSRGEYVWLISADDKLIRQHALARYVAIMEANPTVGYVCSSAVEIRHGRETPVVGYSVQAECDKVFRGHDFLTTLLYSNSVVASAGMVRKSCYERSGAFPLDLPYAGDWYLWCLFALHNDVGYCAEPFVAYRIHERSMTDSLASESVQVCVKDCLAVLWRIKREAEATGLTGMIRQCDGALGYAYAQHLTGARYRFRRTTMGVEECKDSIGSFAKSTREAEWILTRMYVSAGDISSQDRDYVQATEFYRLASRQRFWMPKLRLKSLLLRMGTTGGAIRKIGSAFRL